ncbi:hypothetical protein [Parasitella parasitica]|uniref:Autophagy-related protein 11 n=1 Tax=Parasitella parasitica TaxID=35722 RepID=A0A0B7N030_9FUNG|nr:hypothetical protein [Parasitella parasitica]
MKVYRSETGIQIKCSNTNNIKTLSELKEAIENACGVPTDKQVLMTSLGIQVKDANLLQVLQSEGSDESIVLCYDTRCYLSDEKDDIQTVLVEEIPVLDRIIPPIDGTSLTKQFKRSLKALSKDDACTETLKLFNAIDNYSRSLIDAATTHYELSGKLVNEHEIQRNALNVAMKNLETHSNPTKSKLSRYLRKVEQELSKQRPILANVDRDLLFLNKLRIHDAVKRVLVPDDRSKQYLIDFVDQQVIVEIKSDTMKLCDRISKDFLELKTFLQEIDTDTEFLQDRVQKSINMYSLHDIFEEITGYTKTLRHRRSKMKRDLQRAYEKLSLVSGTPLSGQFNSLSLDESRFGEATALSNDGASPVAETSTAAFTPLTRKNSKNSSSSKIFESFLHFAEINIEESLPEMAKYELAVRKRTEQLLNSKKNAISVLISCMKTVSNFQMILHEVNIQIDSNVSFMENFRKKYKGNDLQILPQIVFSYGAIMIELLRRKEYTTLLVTNSGLIGDVLGQYRSTEESRREYFRQKVVKEIPFKLSMREFEDASPQSEISVNGNDKNTQINMDINDITEFISVIRHLYVDTPGIADSPRAFNSPGSNNNGSDSSGSPRKVDKDKSLFNVLNKMKKELDGIRLQWMASIRNHLLEGKDIMQAEEIQDSLALKPEIDTVDTRSSKLTSPTSSIYQLIGNDKTILEENEKLKREIEELRQEKESIQSEETQRGEELIATKSELRAAMEEIERLEQENVDQTEEINQLKYIIKNLETEKEDLESAKRSFLNEIKNKDKSADFRIASAEEDFNAKLSDLQYRLEEEERMKKNLEIEHASELNFISIDHEKNILNLNALIAKEKQAKDDLENEHALKLDSILSQHQDEINQLNTQLQHEKQNVVNIKLEKKELQRRLEQLCENTDDLKEKLETERALHEEQLSHLHAEMEEKDRATEHIKELQEQTRVMVKQCQDDWYSKNEELNIIREEQNAVDVAVRKLLRRFRPSDQELESMSLDGYVDLFRENLEGFEKEFAINKDNLEAATQELADLTEGYSNLIDTHNEWRSVASRMADKLEEFRKQVIFEIVTQLQMPMEKNELIALSTTVTPSDDDAAIWNEILRLSSGVNTQKFVFSVVKYVRDTYNQAKQFKKEYRNIKGDLTLLLPTRNSSGKPWAAFNINAPHYFLKSTENIAAQIQNREWIVARIVAITEHVTDATNPESNPFGLDNGITYHLIEVENWRSNRPNKRRHVSTDSGLASITAIPPQADSRNKALNVDRPLEQIKRQKLTSQPAKKTDPVAPLNERSAPLIPTLIPEVSKTEPNLKKYEPTPSLVNKPPRSVPPSTKPFKAKTTGAPTIVPNVKSIIPLKMRQLIATKLYEAFARIYAPILAENPTVATDHAKQQEEKILETTSNQAGYKQAAANVLMHLKKRPLSTSGADIGLDGEWIDPKIVEASKPTWQTRLNECVLDLEMLKKLKYPLPELMEESNTNTWNAVDLTGSIHQCDRCQQDYLIKSVLDKDDMDACVYHPNKMRMMIVDGSKQKVYACCEDPLGSVGCTRGPHVYKDEDTAVLHKKIPYVKTPLHDSSDKKRKLVALDCEMGYTTAGMELIRLTAVDENMKVLVDELVLPYNMIVDLNSRYSGISTLEGAKFDLDGLRKELFKYIDQDTIIVGHGLENDLNALRIIHTNVIDTVALFPHKNGLPYRNSLRGLTLVHLKKFIQTGTEGHDSLEDASVCIELLEFYIKKVLNKVENKMLAV